MLLGVISIAAGSAAVRLRRRLVPNAPGSAALLYSAIVAVSLLVFLSEILCAAGLLRRWPLALLGAWTVGKRAGVQVHTLTAISCVAALPILALTGGGAATNDMAALALLIAAVVPLVDGLSSPGAILVAGLAAGLALGTKF